MSEGYGRVGGTPTPQINLSDGIYGKGGVPFTTVGIRSAQEEDNEDLNLDLHMLGAPENIMQEVSVASTASAGNDYVYSPYHTNNFRVLSNDSSLNAGIHFRQTQRELEEKLLTQKQENEREIQQMREEYNESTMKLKVVIQELESMNTELQAKIEEMERVHSDTMIKKVEEMEVVHADAMAKNIEEIERMHSDRWDKMVEEMEKMHSDQMVDKIKEYENRIEVIRKDFKEQIKNVNLRRESILNKNKTSQINLGEYTKKYQKLLVAYQKLKKENVELKRRLENAWEYCASPFWWNRNTDSGR